MPVLRHALNCSLALSKLRGLTKQDYRILSRILKTTMVSWPPGMVNPMWMEPTHIISATWGPREATPGNIRKAEHFVAFLQRFVDYLKVRSVHLGNSTVELYCTCRPGCVFSMLLQKRHFHSYSTESFWYHEVCELIEMLLDPVQSVLMMSIQPSKKSLVLPR